MSAGSSRRERLRALIAQALGEQTPPCPSSSADYDCSLRRAARHLQLWQALYDREQIGAAALIAELCSHPRERQTIIVQNNPRFQTWGVLALLLDRSWSEGLQSSDEGEHLARLSLLLSDHLDTSLYRLEGIEDLRARAWSYIGNARRRRSDLAGAEEAFRTAAAHLKTGTQDPIERAMLLDLEASLRRAQRRFSRSMDLLKRAHILFLTAGDRHRAGRTLVNLEIVHHHAGSPVEGIPLLYRALELIDPHQEPRLLLCIWHNLTHDLAEAGRAIEAQRLFRKAASLYLRFPESVTQNRRTWLAGKIARGLGQEDEAVALFLEARQGFLTQDTPYEVALVSLDLAALYAEQGRMAELRQLAVEMVPVFSSRQIHREALAALSYWKQAVEAETARERLLEVVAGVAGFLKRARYDSDLRFTAPA